MGNYRTIDDIIAEKRDSIVGYKARIEAWSNVIIKTKKNGGEFAELSKRCIENAYIRDKSYTAGKELSVYFNTPRTAYESDTLDCFKWSGEYGSRVMVELTPQEMRERITEQITMYKKWKSEQEQSLKWLEENKDVIKAKMEAFRSDLFDGAPNDIGIRHAFGDIVGDGIKYGFR